MELILYVKNIVNVQETKTDEKVLEQLDILEKQKSAYGRADKQLEQKRWEIIQNSGIDFQKFGWVIEISKLFGIATNKSSYYIRKHFPQFYKTCYVRKDHSK